MPARAPPNAPKRCALTRLRLSRNRLQTDVNRILKPRDASMTISGMKCLLLDKDTKTMVSLVTSMHDILSKQVFLVENLESKAPESVGHMKAIIIARPTKESISFIEEHLRSPKFLEYHLFFTNFLGTVRAACRRRRRRLLGAGPPAPRRPA